MAATAHVPGPVKSMDSSIMLLQDVPICHMDSHSKVPESDIVSNEIMHNGVWEHAETVNILARLEEWKQAKQQGSSGVVLLDVGANVGWFTLQAAAMGYHVLAVEPMPRNQGALRRTLCENQKLAEKVTLIPKGLSDKPRKCQLYVLKSNKGNGTPVCEGAAFANLKDSPEYELAGEFPLTTLDEVFKGTMEALADRVQVVKIDVEGFEPQVYATLTTRCGVQLAPCCQTCHAFFF
ncbi:hypothetical protein COHA_000336 [Chlorella ohadii]|uniref:Methyltransferase FkbM domain-containing protein n=1 Tax=Chlorella ohadii TaxID=2649997 RepID=A0AAD5E0S6_9CHLO|nr:hypothetical protein COHA_000336 [Chlorella ohadii]